MACVSRIDRGWQALNLLASLGQAGPGNGAYLELFQVPTLRVGLLELEAGGTDHQTPHAEDEVYYVLQGKATLRVNSDDCPVRPGSIIYVQAGVDHRFYCIEESLRVLVFFSMA